MDSKYLVSGGSDCCVKVWDLENRRQIKNLLGHHSSVASVAISNDGKYLASGSDDFVIRIWTMDGYK